MAGYASQIIAALATLIVGTLSAYALLVRAKATGATARQLLVRLWDWIVQAGYADAVPEHLRRAIIAEITKQEQETPDGPIV